MTSRKRIRRIMNLEVPDRVGMYDSHWLGAIERWEKEDLPIPSPEPNGINRSAAFADHFGYDMMSLSPGRNRGLPSSSTLERGICGERLEWIKIGNRRCTSKEALQGIDLPWYPRRAHAVGFALRDGQ